MVSPRLRIRPATPELLAEVALQARPADVAELWAADHITPAQMLAVLARTEEILIGLDGDRPICAFGITAVSALTGWGCPWMVTTVHIDRCRKEFALATKDLVAGILTAWPRLTNAVDARNTRAIRWLRYLGFEIGPAFPFGPDQLPFHLFEMRS